MEITRKKNIKAKEDAWLDKLKIILNSKLISFKTIKSY